MALVSKKRLDFRSGVAGGKPGFGSIGSKIQVFANHFPVTLPLKGIIYHYDLDLKEQPGQAPPPKPAAVAAATGGAKGGKGGAKQKGPQAAGRGQQLQPGAAGDAPVAGPSGGGGGAPRSAAGARDGRIPKRLKRQIVQLWQEQNPAFFINGTLLGVHDGEKNFYTIKKLSLADGEDRVFPVRVPANQVEGFREKIYNLTVKLAAQLRIEDLHTALTQPAKKFPVDILTAFQVVMREALTRWCPVPGQRTFFFPENKFYLGGDRGGWSAKDAWPGMFISMRPNLFKITLNLDVSHTALTKRQPFDDFYANFVWHETKPGYNRDGMDIYAPNARIPEAERKKAERQVYGLKVETQYSEPKKGVVDLTKGIRRWRCCGIGQKPLIELDFASTEAGSVNGRFKVVAYFKKQYGITLRHPHLPPVLVGSKAKPKFLPMELCTIIEGQKMGRKLSEEEVSNMVRSCAKPAPDRKRQIENLRGNAVTTESGEKKKPFEQTDNVYMREFGIKVQTSMPLLEARLLPVPAVQGKTPVAVKADEATFDSGRFMPSKGVALTSWAIMNLSRERRLDPPTLDKFLKELCTTGAARMGSFPKPANYQNACDQINPRDFQRVYQQIKSTLFKGAKPQLMLIITPRKNSQEYAMCKQFFDVTEGVKSQMVAADVLTKNIERGLQMYVSNLLLKINAKLNGANQIVAFNGPNMPKIVNALPGLQQLMQKPTIIFGADVTHPSPGMSSVTPSIAAVTGSVDKYFSEYRARVRAQQHREEIIQDMEGMAVELIQEFQTRNKVLPYQIIFYRDGVSEGQLEAVWTNELLALRRACLKFGPDYKPGITYIIVGKRHHTRLFPNDRGVGRAGNVAPGTIVDTGICHYAELDYYLCSHFGIQGTSRPAHYHVLCDFNDLDVDTIQMLSYCLCYVYQRCLRAVSVPAPAYYAHHVAFRARYHLDSVFREGDSDTASVLSAQERQEEVQRMLAHYNELITLHGDVRNTQYFC